MSDTFFELKNIKENAMNGYQLYAMAVSANGYQNGFSDRFEAIIDSGAFHTCISKTIMNTILERVFDKDGNKLAEVGMTKAAGVYGQTNDEPIYILPHLYLDEIHLTDVAVTVLDTNNIQCLIGRSILHQCILTLNPELNTMQFDFKECLKGEKQTINGISPFANVFQFAEIV
jgi:hypothetical protein